MRFLGRFFKYLLWSVFSIIVFLLLVGLAKMNWDVGGYISFLNSSTRSVFHWSQPATWADPFRPEKDVAASIDDMLSDEAIEAEFGDFDVYDPLLEEGLNDLPENNTLEEDDFGFVTDESHDSAPTNDSTIQQLIEQRK